MKRQLITLLFLSALSFCAFARQPQKGYRGFIDWSNSLRREKWVTSTTCFLTGFSTSHGYQINPWIFTGAGIDIEYDPNQNSTICAFFAQGRTDLKFGRFTPFGDIRIGYNASRGGGVYISPTIGYRLNWGRKAAINIAAGLTLQGYTADIHDIVSDPETGGWTIGGKIGTRHGLTPFFSFRLGFDF